MSGGLGRRTGGEEGRDGGKKGKERSRAHPLSATPPSHNPLLLAWVRLSAYRVTEGRLLTHSPTEHTQATISNTLWITEEELCHTLRTHSLLSVTFYQKADRNAQTHRQRTLQNTSIHIINSPVWIALCSALCRVCLGLPAHFGTAAKREGEKKEGRRWGGE